jgi:3-hydroxyisobutyrate dehydrogenase
MKPVVAFLGLGAMGSRMALRLRAAGVALRVWSRGGRAGELADVLAPSPRVAVVEADIVLSMVTDDEASRDVWIEADALVGMRRGAIAVECSTLSPAWVATLAERAKTQGLSFVEAPVVGSRPQADAGSLIFLAGGEGAAVEAVRPTLLTMGSAVLHVGSPPAGAQTKLLANALFATQVAALGELLGVARHVGIDVDVLVKVLGELPVMSPSARGAASGIAAQAFAPMFPVRLAAKDLRYATALAARQGALSAAPVLDLVTRRFEEAVARGLAEENLTAVAKLEGDRG